MRLRMFPGPTSNLLDDVATAIAHRAGTAVQTEATDRVHVVTGRLRASIESHVVKPGIDNNPATAYVGSEVDYAAAEEVRHPYLRPSLDAVRDEFG